MKLKINDNWKFSLEATSAPHLLCCDETTWEDVTLPHDWSILFPYNEEEGEGCTGYLLGGDGWYRKHFTTTEEMANGCTIINFDGIYNNATIYFNGKFVDFHPYGYSPINYDFTPYLNPLGEDNIIAIHVDRKSYADSRWYTGSGIYRDVTMYIKNKVHFPVWSNYIVSKLNEDKSYTFSIETKVANTADTKADVSLQVSLIDPNGNAVDNYSTTLSMAENSEETTKLTFDVKNPILWDLANTNRYTFEFKLVQNDIVIDESIEKVGLRDCKFDTNKGFFLNGVNMKIKGVCLHHDCGLVGASVPKDVWIRRLTKLKECGCNAIRTAHNPCSEEFLELCDVMGFLVQDEFFDEWDNPKDKRGNGTLKGLDIKTLGYDRYFEKWAKRDLQNTMLRDRNRTCVFQWSIGNEIEWTYPKYNLATGYFGADANGNYFWTLPPYDVETIRKNVSMLPEEEKEVGKTAKMLGEWTREMDLTRPVTANCILPSASYESGYTDALDIVGFSYRQVVYAHAHKNYPDKPIMGTENVAQWQEWRAVIDKDYISGIFLWTGIDYLGEAGKRGGWPMKGASSGILDFAGFEKPAYYMFKSLWQDEPTIHIATQTLENSLYNLENDVIVEKIPDSWKTRLWVWQDVNPHWNYKDGQTVIAEIYSNCDSVTLYQNGVSLGEKHLCDFEDRIYKWAINFSDGDIKAVGTLNGKTVEETIYTGKEGVDVSVTMDKTTLVLDEGDVSHIEVQVVDSENHPVKHAEYMVEINVDENVKLLGCDNGWINNVQTHNANSLMTHNGRCLFIVQGLKLGTSNIEVSLKDVATQKYSIEVIGKAKN